MEAIHTADVARIRTLGDDDDPLGVPDQNLEAEDNDDVEPDTCIIESLHVCTMQPTILDPTGMTLRALNDLMTDPNNDDGVPGIDLEAPSLNGSYVGSEAGDADAEGDVMNEWLENDLSDGESEGGRSAAAGETRDDFGPVEIELEPEVRFFPIYIPLLIYDRY